MIGLRKWSHRFPAFLNFGFYTSQKGRCTERGSFSPEVAMIPPYEEKVGESLKQKKARLLYQSRKRGMLENSLLLSTFAAKYLNGMNDEQLRLYDRLINLPSNDWDIFYWATGVKPTPDEFDNEVMELFKEHVKNKEKTILKQPDLQLPT